MSNPSLYILPSPVSNTVDDIYHIKEILLKTKVIVTENIKSSKSLLAKLGLKQEINKIDFFLIKKKHNNLKLYSNCIKLLKNGKSITLLSEAGLPCIADPGTELVRMAHNKNIKVTPISGPSSIFMALMASGLNGQQFTFHGYLPIKKKHIKKKLKELEKDILTKGYTQLFIETPYRNNSLLKEILQVCNESILLCLAVNINSKDEFIKTQCIKKWKLDLPDLHKKHCVFILGI